MKTFTKIFLVSCLTAVTGIATTSNSLAADRNDVSPIAGVLASSVNGTNPGSSSLLRNDNPNSTLSLDPPTIIGPLFSVCPGQVRQYTCLPVAGATDYEWVVPPTCTIITGQGTTSIDVSFGQDFFQGYLRVTASNATEISPQTVVTVYSSPTTPLPIQGPLTGACAGETYTFSIPEVVSAQSYTWTAPTGAIITTPAASGNPITTSVTSVDITFPAGFIKGDVSVRANSACNSSNKRVAHIRSVPVQPSLITGLPFGVCDIPNVPYSVNPVSGATGYTWTITPSQGSTIHNNGNSSITVDFDQTFVEAVMCVTADNDCGHSVTRCMQIKAHPAPPTIPVGPAGACNNDPLNSIAYYEVDPVFNTTHYRWFVPTGAVIENGQGTRTIRVNYFGASSGMVEARAINSCGGGSNSVKVVTVNACRLANGELSQMELNAYPNPAKDKLTLSFTSISNGNYSLQMVDMTGRVVMNRDGATTEGTNKTELSLENISTGLYSLVLTKGAVTERLRVVVE